jgi:hypothetical protein
MREILFRGKRLDNGEWVEGSLWTWGEKIRIHQIFDILDSALWFRVDPGTVGQCTGLCDKNGRKIFEGDMFRMDEDDIAVVIFKDGCFRLEIHGLCGTWTESGFDECGGGYGIIECDPIDWYYIKDMDVIGNIHDNPELLKGE